jgi:hypothetical protein
MRRAKRPAVARRPLRRMKSYFWLLAVALNGQTAPPAADPQEIIRRAFLKDVDVFDASRDYTYWQHRVVTELGKDGDRKVTKDETDEIIILYGRPYSRLVRKDGHELSSRETAREEQKLNKESAQRKKGAGNAAARDQKEIEDRRRATRELSEAFHFELAGVEWLNGREAWMIDAVPNPGFQPKTRQAAIYPKVSGRIWIDCIENRLVKVRADVNEKISFGWIILQLFPGAVFEHERVRMDDEVWLPSRDWAKGEAKIGGIKTVRAEVETTYSNYHRFRADSTLKTASDQ